jgi:hypothetical protein
MQLWRPLDVGRVHDRLPNRTPSLPESGKTDQRKPIWAHVKALTCGFWVELRGFEPLTPSMRTECAGEQNRCLMTLLQVRAIQTATITAPDRV